MLIILSLVVTIFSSSCAPYPVVAKIPANKISEKKGLPLGTVITVGGKKMVVVSQENEDVRLKSFVKSPVVGVKSETPKGVVAESSKGEVKPEWESKTVITEGVKNVQECHNPMGCPQDTKTGECLEGCTEQKVHVEMTETIIEPEIIVENTTTDKLNHDLVVSLLLHTDPLGHMQRSYKSHYGKPTWICLLSVHMGDLPWKNTLVKLIVTTPKLLDACNKAFSHWTEKPWENEAHLSSPYLPRLDNIINS